MGSKSSSSSSQTTANYDQQAQLTATDGGINFNFAGANLEADTSAGIGAGGSLIQVETLSDDVAKRAFDSSDYVAGIAQKIVENTTDLQKDLNSDNVDIYNAALKTAADAAAKSQSISAQSIEAQKALIGQANTNAGAETVNLVAMSAAAIVLIYLIYN